MRKIVLAVLSVFMSLVFSCASADLEIHFIDVGQGDAALILCDGESMLIDGGPPSASEKVYSYVRSLTDHIDCVIATHPHADHIGGIPAVLNAVPVDLLLSPVLEWNSSIFANIQRYAEAQGTQILVPQEGDTVRIGGAEITIVHCWPEAWAENDMSIVARLVYGDTSVIFTGDAEEMSEYMMLDSGFPLVSDVIKIAHHGSEYSSCDAFLRAVSPKYAVISCGEGNDYAHPNSKVLGKLKGVSIYRTDLQGDILMKSDGHEISFTVSREADRQSLFTAPKPVIKSLQQEAMEEERTYILNRNSMKFHTPDCTAAKEISPRNRIEYTGTIESLLELGYSPCGFCMH